MSYADRQEFIRLQREKCDAKILEATHSQREAEEQRKKNKEWKESKEVIESIHRKPKQILTKDRKKVERLLELHFPVTETTGEGEEKEVTQISCLKFIPKQVSPLTLAKQQECRKNSQTNQGIKMHILEYYLGLIYKPSGTIVEWWTNLTACG
jgi:cell division septum initiation protein DivIVA